LGGEEGGIEPDEGKCERSEEHGEGFNGESVECVRPSVDRRQSNIGSRPRRAEVIAVMA